jgi:hypothetical protein
MPGFMIKLESSARGWYLLGTIIFVLIGVALCIGGFAKLGTTWGIAGLIVAGASTILMIDAIMNYT